MLVRLTAAIIPLFIASAAAAEWMPGSEITGQQVQVETNGVMNTIVFEPNGVARISSPSGATVVDAQWSVDSGKLCMRTSSTFDCYPYQTPFGLQQPVDLVSDCGVRSRWNLLTAA